MRTYIAICLPLLGALCLGQTSGPPNQESPAAIIQVQRDHFGANMVQVSMQDPQFPQDALKAEAEQVGVLCGSGTRGLTITDNPIDPAKPNESRLLRATFAVDGLVDRQGKWFKIAPIVKAFAGAPSPHELRSLQIDFDYEVPTPQDLNSFNSSNVEVSRRLVDRSVEYAVHLKTQDPKLIDIPDFAPSSSSVSTNSSSGSPDWLIIGTVGIAILAIGALVYSLFLLNPSARRRPLK